MITLDIPAPTTLGPESNGMLMTPEEFDAIEEYDREYRYELVNGVVIVNAAPGPGERKPNETLGYWILLHKENHPLGHRVDETLPEQYIRTTNGRRRADRAIWVGLGRLPDIDTDVPAIAVEFVSGRLRDRRRDYVEKRREYAEAGIQEYWIVDRSRRCLVVFRGDEELALSDGIYQTPLIPGWELSLPALMTACGQYA